MILAESTWEEVSKSLGPKVVAVLPLGSNEQHGLHLPVNNDIFCAYELAKRAAQAAGDSVTALVLPPLPYGVSWHHMGFPGTITLSNETFSRVVKDICRSLTDHGIGKIMIVNGHGGNLSAIGTAMQELHQETGAKIAVVNWWELGGDLIKEDFGFIFHACETETSVAAALGQRVLMSRARGTKPVGYSEFIKFNLVAGGPKIQAAFPSFKLLSKTGSIGDPTKADVKKGKRIVNKVVERMTVLLKELAASK